MARQSSNRPKAGEPATPGKPVTPATGEEPAATGAAADTGATPTAATPTAAGEAAADKADAGKTAADGVDAGKTAADGADAGKTAADGADASATAADPTPAGDEAATGATAVTAADATATDTDTDTGDDTGTTDGTAVTAGGGASGRELWDEVRIAPVEIALPAGVALTLRAYRLSSQVTPTEVGEAEDDPFEARTRDDEDEVVIVDEEFAALVAEGEAKPRTGRTDADADADAPEPDPADFADDADEDDDAADTPDEEVPLFLTHRGRLLAFKSPASLVAFIRSGAPHDLAQLDTWATLADRVQSTDVDPLPEDRYELDLVVENLRGGHDTWDLPLLIAAGEVARDLGYALRLKPVILALSPGSPLDDLDESLRAAEGGGMSGFFGRRKLRKIGAQQASLGWRSVIGKISAAVDWRD